MFLQCEKRCKCVNVFSLCRDLPIYVDLMLKKEVTARDAASPVPMVNSAMKPLQSEENEWVPGQDLITSWRRC